MDRMGMFNGRSCRTMGLAADQECPFPLHLWKSSRQNWFGRDGRAMSPRPTIKAFISSPDSGLQASRSLGPPLELRKPFGPPSTARQPWRTAARRNAGPRRSQERCAPEGTGAPWPFRTVLRAPRAGRIDAAAHRPCTAQTLSRTGTPCQRVALISRIRPSLASTLHAVLMTSAQV